MTASPGPAQSATAEGDGGGSVAIRVQGLRKNYGPVVALDGVDLEIRQGEFFTLLGPSGSGKTTLLRLIAGFERPEGGTIELAGRASRQVRAARARRAGARHGAADWPGRAQAGPAVRRPAAAGGAGQGDRQ